MCPSKYAASDLEGAETVDRPERICRGRCAAARAPHRRWLRRLVARQNAVKAVISIPTDGCPGRIRRRRVWSSPRGSSKRHPPQTYPDAVRADIDVLSRGDLDRASPRRRLDADVHRPWRFPSFGLSLLFQLFSLSLVKLEDPLARERLLEPVEELGGRIDLVVMLAIGEDGHLVEVFGEPRCTLWDVDKPVLDHRGLRVHPHDLVAVRLVAGDPVAAVGDQFLDQLSARGLVLDQHRGGTVEVLLFADRALECRIFEPLAQPPH